MGTCGKRRTTPSLVLFQFLVIAKGRNLVGLVEVDRHFYNTESLTFKIMQIL